MPSQTIARAIAPAAAILIVGAALLLVRSPSDDVSVTVQQHTPRTEEPDTPPRRQVEPAVSPSDTAASLKARELEAMSETFRNTTFVTAIRDAGFVCYELLRVYGGMDASAKWMATCSEMHAYTIGVASTGELHVEPALQYFDGQWPVPIQTDDPTLVLPQQPRLPPQRLPEQR